MKYELIIVRYGEIALKGKEIRKRFENTLISNIKNAFDIKNIKNIITKEWGRIYIWANQINKCIYILRNIFGIISISPALKTVSDIDSMSKLAIDIAKKELKIQKSFAIRTIRVGEHKFTSQDVAIKIGEKIVKETKASVNLKNPDFELFVEIRNDNAFLFTEKIRCIGGLPLGTQGKILALIDTPESILAAWYLMRRGCKIIYTNIKESNNDVLKSFSNRWFTKPKIFTINSMENLYEKINKIAINENCDAIVTNHTICYDSKNALSEIKQLKKHVNFSILHPLIAMTKDEITSKCKEIGISI